MSETKRPASDLEVLDECPVCCEKFETAARTGEVSANHVPRVLKCGHTICHQCVVPGLVRGSVVRCPL